MFGLSILTETLSQTTLQDSRGVAWQYHSRSDRHSKIACWGIIFDLVRHCSVLRRQIEAGRVCFGINHEMRDFAHDRKKNLDLVLCTPAPGRKAAKQRTLLTMVDEYELVLGRQEKAELADLPQLSAAPVGSVLLALEAKACMTAHQRALPRLYDELNSSHLTVHGSTDQAIAAGFVMINAAPRYLSPDLNKRPEPSQLVWSSHQQPRDATLAIEKVKQLPRRSKVGAVGYDALAIAVVECANDGSAVRLVTSPPAPIPGDIYHYASMIERLSHLYATRFQQL